MARELWLPWSAAAAGVQTPWTSHPIVAMPSKTDMNVHIPFPRCDLEL